MGDPRSLVGVGTITELFIGLVLDDVTLSNYSLGCTLGPKPEDDAYKEWRSAHVCQNNTDSKTGQIEVEAALFPFEWSLQHHNLRDRTVLSDGDSRSCLVLQEGHVYEFMPIEKEDCTTHVHKHQDHSQEPD